MQLEQEQKLIAECRTNKTAFSELYQNFTKDIYRYTYSVSGNKEQAEDLTSKTFLVALEKISTFEWRGISIKYWFLQIARNLIYQNIVTKNDLSVETDLQEEYLVDLDEKPLEEQAVDTEQQKLLKELIFQLDPESREIITLKIWEDMKFKEIAEFLNVNQSTAISKFHRGVKSLQNMLAKKDYKKFYSINPLLILIGIKQLKSALTLAPDPTFLTTLSDLVITKLNNFQFSTLTKMNPKTISANHLSTAVTTAKATAIAVKLAVIILPVIAVATASIAFITVKNEKSTPKAIISPTITLTPSSIIPTDLTATPTNTVVSPTAGIDTSNWQSYTNNAFPFSLKYPPTWVLDTSIDPKTIVFRSPVGENCTQGKVLGSYEIFFDMRDTDFTQLKKGYWPGTIADPKLDKTFAINNSQQKFQYFQSGEGEPDNYDKPTYYISTLFESYVYLVNNKYTIDFESSGFGKTDLNFKPISQDCTPDTIVAQEAAEVLKSVRY
ncbi:MAG: sigma-70 family RNA polymerase sigma factor [bacterium]